MKKRLLLSFMLIISLFAFADKPIRYINDYEIESTRPTLVRETVQVEEVDIDTAKIDFTSRWSVTLEAGFNRFDGDIIQKYNSLVPTSVAQFSFGGSLEYTLAPAWSFGLDYYYLPLKAEDIRENGFVVADFKSTMHNVSLFTSFNLIKGFFPQTTTKWGLWANVGLGYAWYNSVYKTDRAGTAVEGGYKTKYIDFNDSIPDGRAMFVPLTLLLEYNFTKNLALGIKAQSRAFNKDYIEQRIHKGVTNDFVELLTAQLRFKFVGSPDDNKYHTRNPIPIVDYQSQIDRLQNRVNGIVIPPPAPNYDDRLNDLEGRVKKMEDILCPDGPDGDADGVPDCRDQEPETPAGNQVDFWGRTIEKPQIQEIIDENAFIYFDFDKTGLDNEAHRAIAICARKMNADPELIVEVRGFTDNMGTVPYNDNLSQRRADRVKRELVQAYGIGEQRIIANGKGKYNPQDKTIPFRPYRTCVLFYSK